MQETAQANFTGARVRSKEASLENLADSSKLGDMDDPKAMARWAKRWVRQWVRKPARSSARTSTR